MTIAIDRVKENLEKFGVTGMDSDSATVQAIRATIQHSPNPLAMANNILRDFGAQPENENVVSAIVKAQAVVLKAKEAARTGSDLNEDEMEIQANEKVQDMVDKGIITKIQKVGKPTASKKGAKRDRAKELYLSFKDKPIKEIAVEISAAMDVSLANAYTYIYNVKKMLGEATGTRGRKPNVK
jgi:hypothetical protein